MRCHCRCSGARRTIISGPRDGHDQDLLRYPNRGQACRFLHACIVTISPEHAIRNSEFESEICRPAWLSWDDCIISIALALSSHTYARSMLLIATLFRTQAGSCWDFSGTCTVPKTTGTIYISIYHLNLLTLGHRPTNVVLPIFSSWWVRCW